MTLDVKSRVFYQIVSINAEGTINVWKRSPFNPFSTAVEIKAINLYQKDNH